MLDLPSHMRIRNGEIDVPERPTSLAFGGKDGRTLFILARTSLYEAAALGDAK